MRRFGRRCCPGQGKPRGENHDHVPGDAHHRCNFFSGFFKGARFLGFVARSQISALTLTLIKPGLFAALIGQPISSALRRVLSGHGPYRRGDVVATSFKETVAEDDDDAVAEIATNAAKSKFSENLLRNILDSALHYFQSGQPCWIWSAVSTRCKEEPQNQRNLPILHLSKFRQIYSPNQ